MSGMEVVVGVTGLNATDNPGPGISVIRALRAHPEFKGKIIGLSYDPLDPGVYASDLVDSVYLMPFPSEGIIPLRKRLSYIKETSGLSLIIPTLDSELSGFMALESELKEVGIGLFLPTKNQYEIRSKVRLSEICKEVGIDFPRTKVISNIDAVYKLPEEIDFPFVLKGIFYGAMIVNSLDEALSAFFKITSQWGIPLIVQEFLTGEEYDIAVVGDGRGGLVGGIPIKKTTITDKGKGWAGITVKDPTLMEMARRFCHRTRWRGPCELEVLKTQDEHYYLLEINPRFPAWIYLSAKAGHNLPFAVVQLAMGMEPAPLSEYHVGTMFVRISMEQVVGIKTFEEILSRGEIHYENLNDCEDL